MHKFRFKVIQGNLSEGRCSLVRETAELVVKKLCFLGRSCGISGKLTTGKPYWRHPGAKFGHFVGDVEAKSGYGDFKWVLASYVGPIGGGSNARIKATF